MRPKNSASLMNIITSPKLKYRSVTPSKKGINANRHKTGDKDDGKDGHKEVEPRRVVPQPYSDFEKRKTSPNALGEGGNKGKVKTLLKEIKQAVIKSNIKEKKVNKSVKKPNAANNKQAKCNIVEIRMIEQEFDETIKSEACEETSKPLVPVIKQKSILRNSKATSSRAEISTESPANIKEEIGTVPVDIKEGIPINKFVIPKELCEEFSAADSKEHFNSMNLKCERTEDDDKEIKDYLKSMIKGKKPGTPSFGTPRKKSELALS